MKIFLLLEEMPKNLLNSDRNRKISWTLPSFHSAFIRPSLPPSLPPSFLIPYLSLVDFFYAFSSVLHLVFKITDHFVLWRPSLSLYFWCYPFIFRHSVQLCSMWLNTPNDSAQDTCALPTSPLFKTLFQFFLEIISSLASVTVFTRMFPDHLKCNMPVMELLFDHVRALFGMFLLL